jgi:hypothetical protein
VRPDKVILHQLTGACLVSTSNDYARFDRSPWLRRIFRMAGGGIMLKLVREATMAIQRSIGLIDESRDLIEVSRRTLIEKIQPIPCAKCGGDANRIRRAPDPLNMGAEMWTFRCDRCAHLTRQFNKK